MLITCQPPTTKYPSKNVLSRLNRVAMAKPVIKIMLTQASISLNLFMILYFIFSENFETYFSNKSRKFPAWFVAFKASLKELQQASQKPTLICFYHHIQHLIGLAAKLTDACNGIYKLLNVLIFFIAFNLFQLG